MMNHNKRDRLIDSAAVLFHRNGLSSTSLADIAKHADIPIGNVYYYFKTKDELALAAISKRKEQFSNAYALLDEGVADPRQRLIESIGYYDKVRDEYTSYGCPIGKIITDVDVAKDPVGQTAAQVLTEYVGWAERQFSALGHDADGRKYAASLMAGVQGAIVMAKALRDPQVISDEVKRLTVWLENVPNRKIHIGKVAPKTSEVPNAA
ncbi:MAG: TetR/AcrR family transcriptional regulator [Pseudomonadota bacterium]|nr:TetR/AcrR family transcriptional regulator [Pseudomonadota bacterium]